MSKAQSEKQMARNSKFVWQDGFAGSGVHPYSVGFVGYVLSNRDNGDGKGFYASAQHVSDCTGISVRTVERAIAQLLEEGWIEQVRRGGRHGGENVASHYRLAIPNPSRVTVRESSQPVMRDAQPVMRDAQPVTGDGLVDQIIDQTLDQTPLTETSSHSGGPEATGSERQNKEEVHNVTPEQMEHRNQVLAEAYASLGSTRIDELEGIAEVGENPKAGSVDLAEAIANAPSFD